MKPNWHQIIFSLILGMLLPSLTLRLGSVFVNEPTEPQTEPTQSIQTQPTQAAPLQRQIPVLSADGSLEHMDLESYLIGVVLAEMPASFEPEALKAQAIVARTYAWKRHQDADHHTQKAVCRDSTCCQAYISSAEYLKTLGTQADVDKITEAVRATAGQVLTYRGELAEATYFSCSGGRTEDAAAVWGADIPYLQSVPSPGEEEAAVYTDTVTFTPTEFAEALGRRLYGKPQNWLSVVTRSEGGGVETMVLAGLRYSGVQLRQLLELNSTAFTMTVEDGNIVVTTKGKGHRVGMSQYGADAMAVQGSTCRDILAHYYPGTVIDKWDPLG